MEQKSCLKIGAVSFLNTKPLIYPLLNGQLHTEEISLSVNVPSRLATQLRNDELDIGLIPIVEYFRANAKGANYRIIPNIAIVLSIQLFSHVPVQDIQQIALATSSRSSVALLKILLSEIYQLNPAFISCDPSIDPVTAKTDAVLLIGDAALKNLGATKYSADLGTVWHEFTGLPFVYACWVARGGVCLGNVPGLLLDAKKYGVGQISEIARNEAPKLGFTEDLIHYDLDESSIDGLEQFYKLAVKNRLVESGQTLSFANTDLT